MSYAAPLAYASQVLSHDPYAVRAAHHPRPVRQRRRRLRVSLRLRQPAGAATALATDASVSR
jgi:hypothetical protein